MKKPDYGSYIPRGLITGSSMAALAAFAISSLVSKRKYKIALAFSGAASILTSFYMSITMFLYRDSRKIALRDAILELLPWDGEGEALDIGTGSGLLAVGLAGKFPDARVIGTDIWKWSRGAGVGSTRERAEENAIAEGVSDRVTFREGDARRNPFPDESFDAVVTNYVWHNIMIRDRYPLIQEAFRLLKPGGAFMFCDLFKRKSSYGEFDKLLQRISGDVDSVSVTEISELGGFRQGLFEDRWICILHGRKQGNPRTGLDQ